MPDQVSPEKGLSFAQTLEAGNGQVTEQGIHLRILQLVGHQYHRAVVTSGGPMGPTVHRAIPGGINPGPRIRPKINPEVVFPGFVYFRVEMFKIPVQVPFFEISPPGNLPVFFPKERSQKGLTLTGTSKGIAQPRIGNGKIHLPVGR